MAMFDCLDVGERFGVGNMTLDYSAGKAERCFHLQPITHAEMLTNKIDRQYNLQKSQPLGLAELRVQRACLGWNSKCWSFCLLTSLHTLCF